MTKAQQKPNADAANAIAMVVIDGLIDNSRTNGVPYSDGWDDAYSALNVYYGGDDPTCQAIRARLGDHEGNQAIMNAALNRIQQWMDNQRGKAWPSSA